ncbi:uncharacterized protein LOC133927739 [Phragmites australis]|uniref:uncharacterized protein LOC133927739 n=1 Tax=Phragmites australis TaxID=29695 RepID=UPI002D7977C4|nr:uncharacterized protein LOC133927739 [Phragmites australis]
MDKLFRYEAAWERHEGFRPTLEQARGSMHCQSAKEMCEKLRTMAGSISAWGKESFGNVRSELRALRKRLLELRSNPARVRPSYEEKKVDQRIVELNLREEILWRQRSQVQWLAEGDSNTQFFHQKASLRKRKNRINKLILQDGTVCENAKVLEGAATSFYEQLYKPEETIGIESEDEIKNALFQMFPTKPLGLDGFPAHLFQKHWDICGNEVTAIVLRLLNGEDSLEEINKTFIVLIPKSAFVPGRLITDNIITAYECLHFMKKKKCKNNSHCALKLDMMKAYDRVEWRYLEAIILKLGFAPSILFFKAKVEGASWVRDRVQEYCNASGQKVNLDKSSIFFGKGCPEDRRSEIKVLLDIQNESLNEQYPGLPSDVGKQKNCAFQYLKDRVWKRVQGWMERCLSAGGKEILIKSVAQAIPTYSMACFLLPRELRQHIHALIRKFWWRSKAGERKTAWVAWDAMVMPKYMGGLGFKDIELFNLAMLARQAWRILQSPESLSARVLKAVYFSENDLLNTEFGDRPSQIWRGLHAEWKF